MASAWKPENEAQKEHRRHLARLRYAADPEKHLLKNAAKRKKHPDRYAESSKRWKDAHAEELRAKRLVVYQDEKANERHLHILRAARNRAALKGLPFDLTLEWVRSRSEICELSGLPFRVDYDGVHQRNPFAPSIDRISSVSGGYTQQNCRVIMCCLNVGLGEWGFDVVVPAWRSLLEQMDRDTAAADAAARGELF